MFPNTVIGKVAGTGIAINVVLGFKPDFVECYNANTGQKLARFRGQANTFKTVSAGTITTVTGANGLADYTGATQGEGFTIPADAQVNVNGQDICYVAVRSAPGAK